MKYLTLIQDSQDESSISSRQKYLQIATLKLYKFDNYELDS